MLFRKLSIACLLAVCGLAASQTFAQTPTKIKFILNWKYYGPQAWFFIAQDKGYFKAAGLDVEFDQGDGSPGAPTKVAAGAYDAGFGDLPTVIQLAAQRPAEAPIGVYMLYSNPPSSPKYSTSVLALRLPCLPPGPLPSGRSTSLTTVPNPRVVARRPPALPGRKNSTCVTLLPIGLKRRTALNGAKIVA